MSAPIGSQIRDLETQLLAGDQDLARRIGGLLARYEEKNSVIVKSLVLTPNSGSDADGTYRIILLASSAN